MVSIVGEGVRWQGWGARFHYLQRKRLPGEPCREHSHLRLEECAACDLSTGRYKHSVPLGLVGNAICLSCRLPSAVSCGFCSDEAAERWRQSGPRRKRALCLGELQCVTSLQTPSLHSSRPVSTIHVH